MSAISCCLRTVQDRAIVTIERSYEVDSHGVISNDCEFQGTCGTFQRQISQEQCILDTY